MNTPDVNHPLNVMLYINAVKNHATICELSTIKDISERRARAEQLEWTKSIELAYLKRLAEKPPFYVEDSMVYGFAFSDYSPLYRVVNNDSTALIRELTDKAVIVLRSESDIGSVTLKSGNMLVPLPNGSGDGTTTTLITEMLNINARGEFPINYYGIITVMGGDHSTYILDHDCDGSPLYELDRGTYMVYYIDGFVILNWQGI